MTVSDKGSELTSNASLNWSDAARVDIAPGKADAERLHRKLERPPSGRAVERNAFLQPDAGQSHAPAMAARLPHHKVAVETWLADDDRLRGHVPPRRDQTLRLANGSASAQAAQLAREGQSNRRNKLTAGQKLGATPISATPSTSRLSSSRMITASTGRRGLRRHKKRRRLVKDFARPSKFADIALQTLSSAGPA